MVFQEPMTSLNPLHTIEKQIGEILELHGARGADNIRARVVELLEEVGIPDPTDRLGAYPHQLSGGQRQRVMIAMALANRPDLFIADEPTTALDVTVQAQILDLLKRLQTRYGMAMLFITHDLNIVRKIADDVAVMQKGRIVEAGPVASIFAAPSHPYTRALLAAEPKGAPPAAVAGAKPVVVAENIRVWFPIKRGFFRRTVGYRQGGRRRQRHGARRRDGRRRRRIGIRQDDAGAGAVAPDSFGGRDRLSRPAHRRAAIQGAAPAPGRHADRLSGPLRLAYRRACRSPTSSPRALACSRSRSLTQRNARWSPARFTTPASIPPSMDRYPHEFSGGQRQRIAIARAVVLEPKFIVLDEPTSALDMSVQAQIVDLLRDLQKRRGLAFLFISHDLRVVRALASEIIVMRHGKLVEAGPAAELLQNPKSEYTRALFAAAFDIKVEGAV